MPKRSRCRWCGYVLPDEQRECSPRGRYSDRYGSTYCRDHRDRFVQQAAGTDGTGSLVIDDHAADVLEQVHRLHKAGLTLDEVAAAMVARGVAPPCRVTSWHRKGVWRLLVLRRQYHERLRCLRSEACATES